MLAVERIMARSGFTRWVGKEEIGYALHAHGPHPAGGRKRSDEGWKLHAAFQSILEELKPEAAYLAEIEGARGGYFVVNMDDASQIPAFVEPFFLGLGATVQIHPVFIPDDMPRVTEAIEQAVRKYG
jgi:hypothetical protein